MAYTVPTTEPTQIRAGETWRWNVSLPDYPNADWTLTYQFFGASAAPTYSVAVSATDDHGYEFTATAANTAEMTAGLYAWTATVTSGTEKHIARSGTMTVLKNLGTATAAATTPEQMISALEAQLLARYSADVSSYSIAQRAVHREAIKDLEASLRMWRDAAVQAQPPTTPGAGTTRTRRVHFYPVGPGAAPSSTTDVLYE